MQLFVVVQGAPMFEDSRLAAQYLQFVGQWRLRWDEGVGVNPNLVDAGRCGSRRPEDVFDGASQVCAPPLQSRSSMPPAVDCLLPKKTQAPPGSSTKRSRSERPRHVRRKATSPVPASRWAEQPAAAPMLTDSRSARSFSKGVRLVTGRFGSSLRRTGVSAATPGCGGERTAGRRQSREDCKDHRGRRRLQRRVRCQVTVR